MKEEGRSYHEPRYHQPSYELPSAAPVVEPVETPSVVEPSPPVVEPVETPRAGSWRTAPAPRPVVEPVETPSPPCGDDDCDGDCAECLEDDWGAELGAAYEDGSDWQPPYRRRRPWRTAFWSLTATVVIAGAAWWFYDIAFRTRFIEEMSVGECADRDGGDASHWPLLRPADCADAHDGEVLAVGSRSDVDTALRALSVEPADARPSEREAACLELAGAAATDVLRAGVADGSLAVTVLSDEEFAASGDAVLCFVESTSGDDLTAPLTD